MDTWMILGLVGIALGIAIFVALRQRSSDVITLPTQIQAPSDLNADVLALLAQGNRIAAVKLVHDRTGMGLSEATAYVARLSGRTTPAQPSAAVPLPDTMPMEAQIALHQGHTLEAIKAVRAATGLGLKEAKEYVDRWRDGTSGQQNAPALNTEQAARELIAQGNTIAAIKLVRRQTGMNLRDAKAYVDAL